MEFFQMEKEAIEKIGFKKAFSNIEIAGVKAILKELFLVHMYNFNTNSFDAFIVDGGFYLTFEDVRAGYPVPYEDFCHLLIECVKVTNNNIIVFKCNLDDIYIGIAEF